MKFSFLLALFCPVFFFNLQASESFIGTFETADTQVPGQSLFRIGWKAAEILSSHFQDHPYAICRTESSHQNEKACYLLLEDTEFLTADFVDLALKEEHFNWTSKDYLSANPLESENAQVQIFFRGRPAQFLKKVLFAQKLQPENPNEFETKQIFCGKKRFKSGGRSFSISLQDYCYFVFDSDEITAQL